MRSRTKTNTEDEIAKYREEMRSRTAREAKNGPNQQSADEAIAKVMQETGVSAEEARDALYGSGNAASTRHDHGSPARRQLTNRKAKASWANWLVVAAVLMAVTNLTLTTAARFKTHMVRVSPNPESPNCLFLCL